MAVASTPGRHRARHRAASPVRDRIGRFFGVAPALAASTMLAGAVGVAALSSRTVPLANAATEASGGSGSAVDLAVREAALTASRGSGYRAEVAANQARQELGDRLAARVAAAKAEAAKWVLPVSAPYTLTSRFAPRWGGFHHGLDFALPVGNDVLAIHDGVVVSTKPSAVYGNGLDLLLADGTLIRYGHLSSYGVTEGQRVARGQVIGVTGNTGRSTGPHVHLEVHPKGDPKLTDAVDPLPALVAHGVRP